MAVAIQLTQNKQRIWQKLLNDWGHSNLSSVIKRISQQTGVASGGADLTLTNTLKGDIIYDVTNEDWYLVTVATSTTTTLNA